MYDYKHWLWERTGLYGTSVGVTELPTAFPSFGIGDIVFNNNLGVPQGTAGPDCWRVLNTSSPVQYRALVDSPHTWRTASPTSTTTVTVGITDGTILIGASGAVALPAGTSWPGGQEVKIKSAGAFSVTITPASGNIDGGAAVTLASEAKSIIMGDGTNYWTVG